MSERPKSREETPLKEGSGNSRYRQKHHTLAGLERQEQLLGLQCPGRRAVAEGGPHLGGVAVDGGPDVRRGHLAGLVLAGARQRPEVAARRPAQLPAALVYQREPQVGGPLR